MKTQNVHFLLLVLGCLCLWSGRCTAQETAGHDDHYLKGYGYLSAKWQNIEDKGYVNHGFNGIFQLTSHFGLGGGGYSYLYHASYPHPDDPDQPNVKLKMGYGGLLPEFRFFTERRLGLFVNSLLGIGGFEYGETSGGFWVIEPHISLSVKITDHLRFDLGTSYRKSFSITSTDISLDGITGHAGIRFGMF